jgi:hypothetical protein
MGFDYISNYYRIRDQMKRVAGFRRQYGDDVVLCSLCFEYECKHNNPKDSYNEAYSQLSWWSDIAKTYAATDSALLIDEDLVPKWPMGDGEATVGKAYPRYPNLYGVYLTDSVKVFNEEGDLQDVTISLEGKGPNGTYWGYVLDGELYPIAFFTEGVWKQPTGFKQLEYENVTGLELTKFGECWYIPVGEFKDRDFRTKVALL